MKTGQTYQYAWVLYWKIVILRSNKGAACNAVMTHLILLCRKCYFIERSS